MRFAALLLAALATLLPGGISVGCASSPVDPVPPDTTDTTPVVYVPGHSYTGVNGYIEYIAGDLPVILSASHGGDLVPAGIPDRTAERCGGAATTLSDRNTRELTLAMADAWFDRTGGYPHVVINHLHRRKLDANRAIGEAACGNASAETAWREYQDFLDLARTAVVESHGRGWFLDIHGHGHDIQRLELGYLLNRTALNLDDDALGADDAYRAASSIATLAGEASASFPELLRGESSLGALFAGQGYPAVPSFDDPKPYADPYFTGGYNTVRHGCSDRAGTYGGDPGGLVCGVQIEANFTGVRDSASNRTAFARVTAQVVDEYLAIHWELDVTQAAAVR